MTNPQYLLLSISLLFAIFCGNLSSSAHAQTEDLENNESTFAMLQIRELIHPDGFVAQLRDMGYVVVEPQ